MHTDDKLKSAHTINDARQKAVAELIRISHTLPGATGIDSQRLKNVDTNLCTTIAEKDEKT